MRTSRKLAIGVERKYLHCNKLVIAIIIIGGQWGSINLLVVIGQLNQLRKAKIYAAAATITTTIFNHHHNRHRCRFHRWPQSFILAIFGFRRKQTIIQCEKQTFFFSTLAFYLIRLYPTRMFIYFGN